MSRLLALPVLLFIQVLTAASVLTSSGLVEGVRGSSVTAYRGIPFAAPPVGDLRWRPPQQPTAWQGVRKADHFSPACTQTLTRSAGPWTKEFMHQGEISEDCLYLNVWSPEPGGRHPVMVWIHGGGFKSGSSATALIDGEAMARKGIVVVTINYRVGVLGFLAHPELSKESAAHVSGNYGLLDQIAALQWVQTNIEAFGGDPARVTVAGQSAGAMAVLILAASPLAKGLFHQVIAQSGNIDGSRPLADAETAGAKFMAAKGARTVHEMRAMSAAKLIAPVPQVPGPNGPVLDGWLLQEEHTRDLATLTGWTADEGSAGVNYGRASESQKEYWRQQQMLSLFTWAKQRADTSKTPVYSYFWNHAPPGPMKHLYGAFHSSEMFYMFDNLGKAERQWTAADREIAKKTSSYWANFIMTGNPNGTGLPQWPAFDSEKPVTMELGDRFMPRQISGAAK